MRTSNKQTEKWAWATPEKLNPEYRKQTFQGALLLIVFGALLTALGFWLAWKFDTWSVEKFTGREPSELFRRRSHGTAVIMLIFNSPWLIGLTMIIGGILSLKGKYGPYNNWKPYRNNKN